MPLTVYDGTYSIFSAIILYTKNFDMDFSNGEDMKDQSCKITIKLAMELKLIKLEYYICKHPMSILYDIFHGINHVMMENPRMHIISHGTSFFDGEPNVDDDLEMGIIASRGFPTTVKATSHSLAMCMDYTS